MTQLYTYAFELDIGQLIIMIKNLKFSVLSKTCHKLLARLISDNPLKTSLCLYILQFVSTFKNLFQHLAHHGKIQ